MEAELKLILKRIPWSLAIKALVFGTSWFVLPWPLFLAVGLYFYLFPFFKPSLLGWHFAFVFGISFFLDKNWLMALFLAVAFYLILGIKDLFFVNRREAYEFLVLLAIFLGCVAFFEHFSSWGGYFAPVSAAFLGALVFFFGRGMMSFSGWKEEDLPTVRLGRMFLCFGLTGFFVFQTAWVITILPFSYFYRVIILFSFIMILLKLIWDYFDKNISNRKNLIYFSVFFSVLVLLLTSTEWSL